VGGNTLLIMPISKAVSTKKGSPKSNASAALWGPMTSDANRLEPASGHKPKFTKGIEKAALSPA
jgi:hypothetical protein